MRKIILSPLGIWKKDIVPTEKQWCIIVQQEYDEQKARNIKIFMSKYLNCWGYEENDDEQAD